MKLPALHHQNCRNIPGLPGLTRQGKILKLAPLLLLAAHILINTNRVIPIDESGITDSDSPAVVIAQVSDLHLGPIVRRPQRRAARAVNRLDPDKLQITGDSIKAERSLPELEAWLESLDAAEGRRFAVLGNWEYNISQPEELLETVYAGSGVSLLVNESAELSVGNRRFRIVGLDDYFGGIVSGTAFQGSTREVTELIMIHEPIVADYISERVSGSWILSGHTHGGQVRFFGRTLYTPPGSGTYLEGSYQVGGNRLIVSRGIGASTLPFRMGPEPDIRILRLPSGKPEAAAGAAALPAVTALSLR